MAGQKRGDVYGKVTNRIVELLEEGVRPWFQPWDAEHAAGKITRPLRGTGEPYSGINVLILWSEAVERGYSAPIWMTYRQAKTLNAHVRKGEHGTTVVYASSFTKNVTDEKTGEDVEEKIPFLKVYTAFNVEQIEGLPAHFYATAKPPSLDDSARIASAEEFFRATGAEIQHGGNRALYSITRDVIQMPHFEFFRDPYSYYSTLGHEAVHWSRHPDRLDRDFGRKRWGDHGYAMEELAAEIGSAFLAADLGLAAEPREETAAYVKDWLSVLKGDDRAIFAAAAHAQKAVEYLHGLQPAREPQARSFVEMEQSRRSGAETERRR